MKRRLFIVSNRLPVSVSRHKGELAFRESPGGLATGLRALQDIMEPVFVGWPGLCPLGPDEKSEIETVLKERYASVPVFLTPYEVDKYYYGFTNRTIWPLFHYFSTYCSFDRTEWRVYQSVNRKFMEKLADVARPEDFFWVHDYHLLLLPDLIRRRFPHAAVGFFLHIPFPSSEIFRLLPWRREMLEGLLGADLIGFHTYEYARHFLSSVLRLLGWEHEFGMIQVADRRVKVENFPMGIDFERIQAQLRQKSMQRDIEKLKNRIGAEGRTVLLSIDRMDYTKGIPRRLRGLAFFLEKYPEWRKRFVYIMLCQPSRTKVRQYALLKEEVDRLVGAINGRFGSAEWIPIHYLYQSYSFERILPLYAAADVALVTPLRDGMNLVAKEYVASRTDESGVLILSETAGSAAELGEAAQVNVNSKTEIAEALASAFGMKPEEQARRMRLMRRRLAEYDLFYWTGSFVEALEQVKAQQSGLRVKHLSEDDATDMRREYHKSGERLFFIDYDGTLVPFSDRPEQACPDPDLIRLLRGLGEAPGNRVVIVSGRDRGTLDAWLGTSPCALVAEHGAWIKAVQGGEWTARAPAEVTWKSEIRPILKTFEARVPGSFVEEKDFGIAWHHRRAEPEFGNLRADELYEFLSEYLTHSDLQVLRGNKVIEVRSAGINKGEAALGFLEEKPWEFILGIGDDWTDEDLFRILPESAYSIKIGFKSTRARFCLQGSADSRRLLAGFLED